MSGHAKLSPSGADRWMTCAGSFAMELGMKDRGGRAANEGTAYHLIASEALKRGVNALAFVGAKVIVWDHPESDSEGATILNDTAPMTADLVVLDEFVIDHDNAEALQHYIDTVRSYATGNDLFVEVAVPIAHLTEEDGAEGTSDTVIINQADREMVVIDLKFGRGVEVQAEHNRQMMMYALGAYEKFVVQDLMYDIDKFRLVISQPRVDPRPSEWTCTLAELMQFAAEVKAAARISWEALEVWKAADIGSYPDSEVFKGWATENLVTSEKGCKFCKAKAKCPALAEIVVEASGADFSDLTQIALPVDADAELMGEPPNAALLAAKMDKVPLIEAWLKAVRAETERELIAGREVPGYKLVRGKKGNRDWVDYAAVDAALKASRIKEEDRYDMTLKSPAKMEKVLKKDKPKVWEKIEVQITQSEGKISVAKADDPREAVSATNVDGFNDLDENLE